MQYKIIDFQTLDSTNSEAFRGGYHHGDVVVSRWQSQGRGQRGNVWNSAPGENLLFSLVLEPQGVRVFEHFNLSIIVALSVSDAIASLGLDCRLKWPNDLYVGDCKIGGILIENISMADYLTKSIIGVGVNVNQRVFDNDLPNPTSLIISKIQTSPKVLLEQILHFFSLRYSQSKNELLRDYLSRLYRSEGFYKFADRSGEFQAKISDVNPDTGQITLQRISGECSRYFFKELEFVL